MPEAKPKPKSKNKSKIRSRPSRFDIGTLRKFMQTPMEWWVPIESESEIHEGTVIRKIDVPYAPEHYYYIRSDVPIEGKYSTYSIDGTHEPEIPASVIVQEYQRFIGPTTKYALPAISAAKPPEPEVKVEPEAKVEPEDPEKIRALKEQMAARKQEKKATPSKKVAVIAAKEDLPADREKSEQKLIATVEKKRKQKQKQQVEALATLDEARVSEEKKLLQAACLALAYAFGKDAPEVCDTRYTEGIEHLATDVVIGKMSHQDAIAAIVSQIQADAEKKEIGTKPATTKDRKPDKEIDTRLARVETDIKALDTQIARLTTHVENVLKRWEMISPFIPSNRIQYFETPKHKRDAEKGGKVGIISYQTGTVEKIPTEKTLDEIKDTQVLFVQNGICIHFKDSVARQLHIEIAKHIDSKPEDVWGYNMVTGKCYFDPSDEPGYDYVRCFDLTRPRTDRPYTAAGGRIKNPGKFVKTISDMFKDDVLIVVAEGAELA